MSIIDFSLTYNKVTKSLEEVIQENYNSVKETLPFNIGDRVKLNSDHENFKNSSNKAITDNLNKNFNIIDVWCNFKNEWSYKLDINSKYQLFEAEYLIKL